MPAALFDFEIRRVAPVLPRFNILNEDSVGARTPGFGAADIVSLAVKWGSVEFEELSTGLNLAADHLTGAVVWTPTADQLLALPEGRQARFQVSVIYVTGETIDKLQGFLEVTTPL